MGHPEFEKVVKIIKALRDPQTGCPWDIKQTHQSLTKYLLEESYEFIHACQANDISEMEDELGDILLQVLLHATIGEQNGTFTLESISKKLGEKMVRRHPHVFNSNHNKITVKEVKENWEIIKSQEQQSYLIKKHNYLPALMAAQKIGEKTARIGFDWKNSQDVLPVVQEELEEFLAEINYQEPPSPELIEEFGDLLFSLTQLGRHLGIDSENALHQANQKFIHRYNQMMQLITADQKDPYQMTQTEMDHYWKKVKQIETKK